MDHLNALNARLANELARLAAARTENERALRQVWMAQIRREIAAERALLGLGDAETVDEDALLEALFS
jgi:hypothetical protein